MSFAIGENVGPYRIVAQLGQGGMATVFKAYHAALDRYVAIKVLHPAFKEDPNFLARFQREAKVVARLEHSNIVPIYDFAEHNGQPYLVMKFIEGETLKARLARGPLTIEEGTRVIEAVGLALAHAHRQGILHRDIKPSNVLLTADGGIFLADFGLARIAAAGETTLSQDMMVGTPQYISPEQAQGEKNLDAGTDVYSLGVVMYEIVVGRVPYSADTPFSIIHDHIYTPLPLPTAINPNVPEAMERVLLKALAKKRQDRYPDAPALVAAFREAAAEITSSMMATGRPTVTPSQATAAPAVALATDAPFAATQAPKAAEAADASAPKSKPAPVAKPKRRPWWQWALAGALGLCGCLALFLLCTTITGAPARNATETARALAAVTGTAATVPAATGTPAPTAPAPGTATAPPALPSFTPANLSEPISAAETAVALNPADANAYLALAQLYYNAGREDDAGRAFRQGAELSGQDPQVYLGLVEALQFKDPVFLLKLLGDGIAANPDNKALKDAAYRPMFLAANQEALLVFEDYQKRFPDWTLPHVAAATYYLNHNNIVRARRELDTAEAIDPDAPEIHLALGVFNEGRGNTEVALIEYRKVIANPDAPEFVRAEALAHVVRLEATLVPTSTRQP